MNIWIKWPISQSAIYIEKENMAKKQKKKRKYTRLVNPEEKVTFKDTIKDVSNEMQAIPTQENRASEKAYVLAPQGSKTYVRNLSDEALLMYATQMRQEMYNQQLEREALESSYWHIVREKEFRGL